MIESSASTAIIERDRLRTELESVQQDRDRVSVSAPE